MPPIDEDGNIIMNEDGDMSDAPRNDELGGKELDMEDGGVIDVTDDNDSKWKNIPLDPFLSHL